MWMKLVLLLILKHICSMFAHWAEGLITELGRNFRSRIPRYLVDLILITVASIGAVLVHNDEQQSLFEYVKHYVLPLFTVRVLFQLYLLTTNKT